MKKRFTEEQIIQTLKRMDAGEGVKELCRELGVSMQTIYVWKRKFGGMEVSDAKVRFDSGPTRYRSNEGDRPPASAIRTATDSCTLEAGGACGQ